MATVTRPELSKKNRYWIDKHRYYELKHFCLQYPLWRKLYAATDGYRRGGGDYRAKSGDGRNGDPTGEFAVARALYAERMNMVERAAEEAAHEFSGHILLAVTEGLSYEQIKARFEIPCCRDVYYAIYRRFFWILSRARK